MEESTIKEKILKKVRAALISNTDNPFKDVDFNSPIYHELKESPEIEFAIRLKETGGTFVYCENEKAIAKNLNILMTQKGWESVFTLDDRVFGLLSNEKVNVNNNQADFASQEVGITRCEFLIARFGSIMVSSGLLSGRRMFSFPEIHIVIAAATQVVPEIKDALRGMKKRYADDLPSQITVISGPSRTADIEKTLIMGAHGPKELYVFFVDDL
jgi:L-lactate dehydrogenase complex protein LldG